MVPDGWSVRRIGDFAERLRRPNTEGRDVEPVSVTKDLGVIRQADRFKKRIATDPKKYHIGLRGEFLYDPMGLYYGALGRIDVVDEALVSPDYVLFEADPSVDHDFLLSKMRHRSSIEYFGRHAQQGNQRGKRRRVYWSVLSDLELLLPSLAEQRKIAAILSSVDEAIERTQAVIDQMQVVKKALMQELLTRGLPGRHTRFKQTEIGEIPESWEVMPLGSVTDLITKGASPRWQGFEYQEQGLLFVTSENVRDGVLDLQSPKFIPDAFGTKLSRSRVIAGDVLVNIVGASIGRAAVFDGQHGFESAHINQAVALVRPSEHLLVGGFLLAVIYSRWGQAYLGLSQVDNARPNVSLGSLRAFPVPVPHHEEQLEIAARLQALEHRILVEAAFLERIFIAKAALSASLLSGEVRVQIDDSEAVA